MPDQPQITGPIAGITKSFEDLGKTLANNVQGPLDAVNKSFSGLGDVAKSLGALGAAAVGPTAAILGFGEAVKGLIEKANPAVFQQFTLAVNDLMAVVGQALVPIFTTVVIPVIRMAADSLMQLAPAGAALAVALQPLVELIGDAFAVAVGILAEAIKAISPVVMAFARVLNDVVRFIGRQIRELLALVGINLPEFGGKPGASVGAAVRQAGHTSVEDVVKQAQRASFSLGTAANDPMGQMANTTKEIKARADQIYQAILDIVQNIDQLPEKIGYFILELPVKLANLINPLPEGRRLNPNKYEEKYGVSFGAAVNEAAKDFWKSVKEDTYVGRQANKPGFLGYTSLKPW